MRRPSPFPNRSQNMRIASFIRSNVEHIAAEWEMFAATFLPKEEFSKSMIRDGQTKQLVDQPAGLMASRAAEPMRLPSASRNLSRRVSSTSRDGVTLRPSDEGFPASAYFGETAVNRAILRAERERSQRLGDVRRDLSWASHCLPTCGHIHMPICRLAVITLCG